MVSLRRLLLGLALLTGLAACGPSTPYSSLGTVEIRDYQGENLSSINDFRENSIKGPQNVDISTYRLRVIGLVDRTLDLTYADVLSMQHYSKVMTLHCVEGWDVTLLWEGIKLSDLFDQAGVQSGAVVAIFRAVDGYSSSLTLDYIRGNNILLADKMNGETIPPARGYPFMLAAESKWGYKWVKWVNEIELSPDANYHGYWEQQGYNNNGDYSQPMFGP
jgi:DMSO/TMAO reductase YedYZ molybdopterin-dependent catalytic subunit